MNTGQRGVAAVPGPASSSERLRGERQAGRRGSARKKCFLGPWLPSQPLYPAALSGGELRVDLQSHPWKRVLTGFLPPAVCSANPALLLQSPEGYLRWSDQTKLSLTGPAS